MSQRTRKFIGAIIILLLMGLYAVLGTAIASAKLADAGGLVHLIYFFVTGLLWVVPAMFVIKWMARPDNPDIND